MPDVGGGDIPTPPPPEKASQARSGGVGRALKRARKAANARAGVVAAVLGMTEDDLARLEAGEAPVPTDNQLIAAAQAIGCESTPFLKAAERDRAKAAKRRRLQELRGATPAAVRAEPDFGEKKRELFLAQLRLGMPIEEAAALCRVSTQTVYRWRDAGMEDGASPERAQFAQDFLSAMAQRIADPLLRIQNAIKGGDIRAATWLLTVTAPEHFSEMFKTRNTDLERERMRLEIQQMRDPEMIELAKREARAKVETVEANAAVARALARGTSEKRIGMVAGLGAFMNDPSVPPDIKTALRLWMDVNAVQAITARNLGE